MPISLIHDINLCGYAFENIAKILLRRNNKNNFIFQLNMFPDLSEFTSKYKLDLSLQQWLFKQKIRADLIEFVFDDLSSRLVREVILYEVKVNRQQKIRPDLTISSYEFYKFINDNKLASVKYLIITPFAEWNFSWNLYDFGSFKPHIYTTSRPKTQRDRIYAHLS